MLQDGKLKSGDHILQIGDIAVRGMTSEQVASVLRQSGINVHLIVARGLNEFQPESDPLSPVVPTSQIDEQLLRLNRLYLQELETGDIKIQTPSDIVSFII